ncbi:hypothetical protein MNBD_CHLOROFLEXI01-1077 [hydrothermal vent metagenome]|uniref:Uncharacterized protein n=1 Tax=hydrothermal vent metagenome TaxID=652676 RepID=A0A3B0VQ74_9ZZZZ
MRGKLLWLGLILLALALYDYWIRPFLGDFWYLAWLVLGVVLILWVYYAFLLRRAGITVAPNYLQLRGPLRQVKISYGRIDTITSSQMRQHYNFKELKSRERSLIKSFFGTTCSFISLNSWPKTLKQRKLWFPRLLFGVRREGLLLATPNWMQLNRDVEEARQKWREARQRGKKKDGRSLAAQILDY